MKSERLSPENRIQEWFRRAWNEAEEQFVSESMGAEAEVLGLGTAVMNATAFIEIQRTYHRTFARILVEVVDLVSDFTSAAGHARFSGEHRTSGCEVDVLFSFSARFEDGQLIWIRHVFDFTALLSQIGTLDPRAVNLVFEN